MDFLSQKERERSQGRYAGREASRQPLMKRHGIPCIVEPSARGGVRATPAWSLRCSTSLYNQLLKFKMEVRWSFVARMGLLQQYVVHKFTYFSGFSSKISMYFVHSQDRDYKDNISGNCNDNSEVTQPIRHHIVPQKYTDCLNQRHR